MIQIKKFFKYVHLKIEMGSLNYLRYKKRKLLLLPILAISCLFVYLFDLIFFLLNCLIMYYEMESCWSTYDGASRWSLKDRGAARTVGR